MLKSIQNIFKRKENESAVDSKKSEQELAYASLLIEVINSDNKFDDRERDKLLEILSNKLDIHKEELDNFTELAQKKSEDSTSLYEFTREINDQYEYEEKVSLITDLWGIAYSDGKLDKYEDYVIRKIADRIYVSHADFIKSKLKAMERAIANQCSKLCQLYWMEGLFHLPLGCNIAVVIALVTEPVDPGIQIFQKFQIFQKSRFEVNFLLQKQWFCDFRNPDFFVFLSKTKKSGF